MADDLRPERRDVADNATPDLRQRYHDAIRECGPLTVTRVLNAVMAVRDEEVEQLRAQIPQCNGICLHVSDVLDDMSNVVGNPVARAHRSCPLHGDLEQVAWELDAALTKAVERAETAENSIAHALQLVELLPGISDGLEAAYGEYAGRAVRAFEKSLTRALDTKEDESRVEP